MINLRKYTLYHTIRTVEASTKKKFDIGTIIILYASIINTDLFFNFVR